MKILKLPCIFLVCVVLFICLSSQTGAQEVTGYTMISAVELKKMRDSEKEILLIDNRPYAAYKQEHIFGAKHFEFPNGNMDQWDASKTGGKSKEDFIGLVGGDKDKPIVFYCTDEK